MVEGGDAKSMKLKIKLPTGNNNETKIKYPNCGAWIRVGLREVCGIPTSFKCEYCGKRYGVFGYKS